MAYYVAEGACSSAIPQILIELSRQVGQAHHVHEISNSTMEACIANRHSRIDRNWSRIDSQAKTHVVADKCSFSVTEYAQECN